MADTLSPEARSRNMARIRSRDTGPEMLVRRAAHALGLRFRLHRKDLPGTPDLVFPGRRVAVLVHGCFWHRHDGCRMAYSPTLDEVFEVLTLVQSGKMPKQPIVLFGPEFWSRAADFDFLVAEGMIAPQDRKLFNFVETADQAIATLLDFYHGHPPGRAAR